MYRIPKFILVIPVLVLLGLSAVGGAKQQRQEAEKPSIFLPLAQPSMHVPPELRQRNWGWPGSCGYASTISLLRNAGYYDVADDIRRNYNGGSGPNGLMAIINKHGLDCVVTKTGDEKFLDWCLETRRGCVIFCIPGHIVNLVGHANGQAIILNNNHPLSYEYWPWNTLLTKWRSQGGWAFSITALPMPPVPAKPK